MCVAFVGIFLFIFSKLVPLSDGFLQIEFKVTDQLIGLTRADVTTQKS